MTAREWKLRSFIVAIMIVTTLITVFLVSAAVLLLRIPVIEAENQREVQLHANEYAAHVQVLLGGIESRLDVLANTHARLSPSQFEALLEQMAQGTRGIHALYLVARDGTVVAAGLGDNVEIFRGDILGSDLSATPLFRRVIDRGQRQWSDTYLSALSGNLTVGLATPAGPNHVLIGEVPLASVLNTVKMLAREYAPPLWVLDSRGEVMIETGNGPRAGRSNLKGLPILQAAGDGEARTADLEFGGKRYHAGVAYSEALHWHFVTTTPAGLDNPRVLSTVLIVVAAFGIAILVSIFLSPTWAQQLAAPLDRIVAQARETAQGGNGRWPRGRIAELNALSADLESMAGALRELNVELEHRVEKRTQALAESNESLSNTLARLEQAQHELVRAEKMAALGGLVAGVAHELNTPIGNGLMAVSTLSDQAREFRRTMQEGLRRSDLEHLLGSVEQATDIAARNLSRAADLVTSFKQVAVDQASSQRRRFELAEVVGEIAVTLGPSLKRTPYVLTTDVPAGLALDSYPGPLGQTLANLINNALLHAFDGRDAGHVHIAARLADDGMIEVDVTDDGKGIPAGLIGRIFDPFVTTRMGRGGTGLGLHIAYNAVTHVLGGSLQVDSAEGQGAHFRLRLPAVAPAAAAGDIHEV